jgi:hypothetical protein
LTDEQKKQWEAFRASFLGRLTELAPGIVDAFATPKEGTKAEAVVKAMRHAFEMDRQTTKREERKQSDAWDDDFNEPAIG